MKKNSKIFIKSTVFLLLVVSLIYGTHLFHPTQNTNIRIVGSSIAFPFITHISEIISKELPSTNIIIETTGTGSGFQLFCQKNNPNSQPDIVTASRPITEKEKALCEKNNISPQELIFGYDAMIVLSSGTKIKNLTREEIFLAISEFTPEENTLKKNTFNYWNEINHTLTKQPIELYGPPYSSGTRDEINKLIMNYACNKSSLAIEYKEKSLCNLIRRDGKYIETGENENLTIQKLKLNSQSLGILGYNFYTSNKDLHAISIDGIYPNFDNITNSKYPLTRPLYLYVNKKNKETLKNFMLELIKNEFFVQNSDLTKIGLIPLKPQQLEELNNTIFNLTK